MTKKMFDHQNKPKGIQRIYLASLNSYSAFKWLFKNESAFRQESILLVIAIPITFVLNISALEQVILIGSILLVMLVEILNTAIEAVVDRVSLEIHPLSGLAKDLGSAAVAMSLLIMFYAWFAVLLTI